jgi:hypothetical protein
MAKLSKRITKNAIKVMVETYLQNAGNATTRYELISFKTKRAEVLGNDLIRIETVEDRISLFGRNRNHEVRNKEKCFYIYNVTSGEFLDAEWNVIA